MNIKIMSYLFFHINLDFPLSSSTMISTNLNNKNSKMQLFFYSFEENNNEKEGEFERYLELPQLS